MGFVRRLRKGVIVVAIAIFLVGWVVVLPPQAGAKESFVAYDAGANRYTVSPTGNDDTANIQAAFDGCVAEGSRCTVQLTSGTFYAAQIVVHDFQGSFQGMGEAKTTILTLPNLPVTKDHPFNAHLPDANNPWPNLFTFFDGTYSISDMTFIEPFAVPTQRYLAIDTPGWTDALYAFISVTGLHANVTVDHVTMIGAPGDFSIAASFRFNVVNGIFAQALLMQPGGGKYPWVVPFQVSFQVTNSAFSTIDDPLAAEDLVDSTVTLTRNTFDTVEWAIALDATSQSVSIVSQNVARNVMAYAGVMAENYEFSALMPCMLPSQVFVTDNDFQLADFGRGVLFFDFGFLTGCAQSLDTVVTGNTFRLGATSAVAVQASYTRSTVVSENTILGTGQLGVIVEGGPGVVAGNEIRGSGIGVLLYGAQGALVQGNDVTDSGQWGIAVLTEYHGLAPNNNLIVQNVVTNSGQFDLFWDGTGTGNVWTGNVFGTEYPPGLNT